LEQHYENYHRDLNRAKWSVLEASHILLGLVVSAFALCGPIIPGLNDTIERRLRDAAVSQSHADTLCYSLLCLKREPQ